MRSRSPYPYPGLYDQSVQSKIGCGLQWQPMDSSVLCLSQKRSVTPLTSHVLYCASSCHLHCNQLGAQECLLREFESETRSRRCCFPPFRGPLAPRRSCRLLLSSSLAQTAQIHPIEAPPSQGRSWHPRSHFQPGFLSGGCKPHCISDSATVPSRKLH